MTRKSPRNKAPVKTPITPPIQHSFNTKKAQRALQAGHTQGEVATLCGVSRWTINKFAQSLTHEQKNIEQYRTLRSIGLTKVQMLSQHRQLEILSDEGLFERLSDDSKIKALFALNTTYGTAYDKERLALGQSTANIGLAGLVSHVHEHCLFKPEELIHVE